MRIVITILLILYHNIGILSISIKTNLTKPPNLWYNVYINRKKTRSKALCPLGHKAFDLVFSVFYFNSIVP